MQKQRIEYDSPVDALIAITKRLTGYENKYNMDSEDFFHKYGKGLAEDTADFVNWSNDYQHYMAVRNEIERQLKNAA
ncbi:antitoxin TumA [Desulfonema magnum]|uniref:Uncharacterized protein n=1 Tax=Desulfonema magnum TaxID=45655 RepID=A0A975GRB9_9BACT|nr:hypothetical protein [Desulfonema magnum]QTA90824.1 Uncharacterized protein dnm_068860 [Desulfonema magnum]